MMTFLLTLVSLISSPLLNTSFAQFDSDGFRQALKVKKNLYLSKGSITGGDRNSSDFSVSNVRVAANPAGYDRFVIDLQGNQLGEKASLARPPFYLVQVDSENKKIIVTLYGKPKLNFSNAIAEKSAQKTKTIHHLDFIPVVTDDRWMFTIETVAPNIKAEVFELSEPARIIIDLVKK